MTATERMFNKKLTDAIHNLACAVRDASSQHQNNAIQAMAEEIKNMAIKVSELKTEVAGLKTQVVKIWGEQQTKYDALKKQFDDLATTIANQEIDAEAQAEFDSFKAKLTEFDDSIPDTQV